MANYTQYVWQIIRKWVKTQPLRFLSKVSMGTLLSMQNTFQCYWTEFATARSWSQIATNHKLRRQGNLICRKLCQSQFVTVQNTNSPIDINSNRGYTPKFRKHIHIKIGPFQEGFLGTSIMSFITDKHTHKHIYQWNNTKMGKNTTFHIHFKSEPGYSPNDPEHVFSVIGLSLRRHGFDHKLRQITNCDGGIAICDCRNLWRFKIQLFRMMSIVPEGILLNAEKMFTSTSDPIKKVSFVHRLWAL